MRGAEPLRQTQGNISIGGWIRNPEPLRNRTGSITPSSLLEQWRRQLNLLRFEKYKFLKCLKCLTDFLRLEIKTIPSQSEYMFRLIKYFVKIELASYLVTIYSSIYQPLTQPVSLSSNNSILFIYIPRLFLFLLIFLMIKSVVVYGR